MSSIFRMCYRNKLLSLACIRARVVRLTVTDWPKDAPLGVIDFTVFGYADGWEPAAVATPTFSKLPLDSEYSRR